MRWPRRCVRATFPAKSAPAGPKHVTNVLRIMSMEWLIWIKRGPIGYKHYTATKVIMV
jgi:hypothetical protein